METVILTVIITTGDERRKCDLGYEHLVLGKCINIPGSHPWPSLHLTTGVRVRKALELPSVSLVQMQAYGVGFGHGRHANKGHETTHCLNTTVFLK